MFEFRFRHWSHREAGLLARRLHSIFSIVKEQQHHELRIFNFEFLQFEIRNSIVELIGIEPTTSWLQTRRSPKLSYSPAAVNSRTA
jgi:hypothetical protein